MRLPARLPVLVILGFLVGAMTVQAQVRDVIQESYKVRTGGRLYIDLDRGNVNVVRGKNDQVYIELERLIDERNRSTAAEALQRHRYSIDQRGDDIAIESRFDKDDSFWSRWNNNDRFRLNLTVYVPEQFHVDFRSGAGNVEIDALAGDVEGRTGAGNVSIGAVRGEVHINSGSGNVNVKGARGRIEVRTGAGNVSLRDVQGYADVTTGAGNIEAEITRQPDADSRFQSGAGSITVHLAPRLDLDVDAVASVGSVNTDFPLRVEGKWMSKSVEGRLGDGGPALRIRTGVGSVSLLRL